MLVLVGVLVGVGATRALRPPRSAAAASAATTTVEPTTTTTVPTTAGAEAVLKTTTTPPTTEAPTAASESRCGAVSTPGPDFDGDGCPDEISVSGTELTVGGARFAVGEAGDIAVLGDWRCDGRQQPGLLRPSTGEVFSFAGWTEPDALTVDAVVVVPDAVAIRPDRACGSAVVTDRNGDEHRVEMAAP